MSSLDVSKRAESLQTLRNIMGDTQPTEVRKNIINVRETVGGNLRITICNSSEDVQLTCSSVQSFITEDLSMGSNTTQLSIAQDIRDWV